MVESITYGMTFSAVFIYEIAKIPYRGVVEICERTDATVTRVNRARTRAYKKSS